MSSSNNNSGNNNNNNPRRKRRWYYQPTDTTTNRENVNKKAKHSNSAQGPAPAPAQGPTPAQAPASVDARQELLKQYEKERIENEKQVLKMEQQLHEFFHKTKTPYSYIDDKGIYSFTPAPTTTTANTQTPSSTQTNANPFMNMTFNPFVPSTSPSLLSSTTPLSTLWASIIPIKIVDTSPAVSGGENGNSKAKSDSDGDGDATSVPTSNEPEIKTVDICEKIEHIDDLIALCDKYPLDDNTKYNINMSAIHAIREPLTDLSNMVGMETIKRTIVDQILYYLQELHIPEAKISKTSKTQDDAKTNTAATPVAEATKPMFNPFAPPFPSPFPGFTTGTGTGTTAASAAGASLPFNIKKQPWANGGILDDFSLPTKGDFMHTVIYGPPGSGKTEVAKIIGRIFSNLGILNKKIFKKVSRNDLVAGYLGQTAIKTKDMIKASLGGVLFIDEAYSLGNSEKRDSFAKECVDTLCEALSEHKHNWMVIIAGYEKELNDCFFSLNEGLNSRFTWRFKLDAYKPSELKSIYEKQVHDYGWTVAKDPNSDTDVIPESWFATRMDYFTTYGRDMETLFTKTKIAHSRRVFCLPMSEKKIITFADLENGFKLFIENPEVNERKERNGGGPFMKTLYL